MVCRTALYCYLATLLQWAALAAELMDPRETGYLLARRADLWADLGTVARRGHDLWDAPRLQDARRLPTTEESAGFLAFARAYREHLEARRYVELTRAEEIQEALRETNRLYAFWDAARDARTEHYYVAYRRQALKRARDLLGDEAYCAGHWPPPVPLWRFRAP